MVVKNWKSFKENLKNRYKIMEGESLENGAASMATEPLWTNPLPVVFKKSVKEKLHPRQSWNWPFEVI